ncbi:hypothetical protein AB0M36_37200 [Actinoplanes sp. NPDC051346]|uniref:hypothetical protein n=1 Tax=Actinoplanes sp. NPDC051346 TaxID=3155048 RepID=UPI00341FE754
MAAQRQADQKIWQIRKRSERQWFRVAGALVAVGALCAVTAATLTRRRRRVAAGVARTSGESPGGTDSRSR